MAALLVTSCTTRCQMSSLTKSPAFSSSCIATSTYHCTLGANFSARMATLSTSSSRSAKSAVTRYCSSSATTISALPALHMVNSRSMARLRMVTSGSLSAAVMVASCARMASSTSAFSASRDSVSSVRYLTLASLLARNLPSTDTASVSSLPSASSCVASATASNRMEYSAFALLGLAFLAASLMPMPSMMLVRMVLSRLCSAGASGAGKNCSTRRHLHCSQGEGMP
mmetsp:Transcript_16471/g.41062  ORF Transcript_16471/g.41062 Transcript_16471/m.41062 type:complete len:227 (-) Transcript_16471:927-1607(-)